MKQLKAEICHIFAISDIFYSTVHSPSDAYTSRSGNDDDKTNHFIPCEYARGNDSDIKDHRGTPLLHTKSDMPKVNLFYSL